MGQRPAERRVPRKGHRRRPSRISSIRRGSTSSCSTTPTAIWPGIEFLKNLPKDKTVQVGVLDVRSNAIDTLATIAARIKKVLAAVPADRVVLSTDCGMKPLARMVAKMKLHSLGEAAKMVRKEVAGV